MRVLLLALVLVGCGEGGGGTAAPTEAPLCEPPELTCEQPQRNDDTPTRYMLWCGETDEDFTLVEYLDGEVLRYEEPVRASVYCWPAGTVALLDHPGTATTCYTEDGRPSPCEPVQNALAAAWGLTPPSP